MFARPAEPGARQVTAMKQLIPSILVGALLVLVAGGCSSSGSIDAWKRGVETYVREQGGGDPAVLRDVTWKDSRKGFAQIGAPDPAKSTDVTGPLVGTATVNEKPWLVFLVGSVAQEKVRDVRVAALSVQNGKYDWRVGKEDAKALKAYRDYNLGLAHRRFPGRKNEPPAYTGFPREDDAFEVSAAGGAIGVTHPASGAKWHVAVNPPKKK
jgi:hypothetical protein